MLQKIRKELKQVATKSRADVSQRFFKTGPGEYGEGDVFVGVTMPDQRKIAKRHLDLSLEEIRQLLNSKIHEERMVGLLILTYQYPPSSDDQKRRIAEFYLQNVERINSWDLVDATAPNIVGNYLWNKYAQSKSYHEEVMAILRPLAISSNLWERRISIVSTHYFIRRGDVAETFALAKILISDKEDLIHKAVGWMLREAGKSVGNDVLEEFMQNDKLYKEMPRTMLRYAIERFHCDTRKNYLKS